MLDFYLVAEAPDGGLGYRNSKDSRLGVFVVAKPEDYYLAIGALWICQQCTERPLFIHKVMEKVIVCEHPLLGKLIQFRVNKEILLALARDAADPMQEILEDLAILDDFIEVAKEQKETILSDLYRDEMLSFLERYLFHISLLIAKNPLSLDIEVIDLETVQGHPNWESSHEMMKQKYSMLYGQKED